MKRSLAFAAVLAALLGAAPAFAQTNFPTQQPGINAGGSVDMCQNSTGVSVACSEISPLPVKVVAAPAVSVYPTGSRPIGGNSTGSTGAVVGTLAAAGGKTTYICGFNVQAIGGTATVGPIVVAGLNGGSQTYQTDVNSATVGKTVAQASFSPCIPAATFNTAITITTTANGTATAVGVNSWGFQL